MRKNILYILTFIGLYLCTPLYAKEYKVKEVPMVHLQDRTRYVSNPDGILNHNTVKEIDQLLFNLENETGVQTLVAVLGNIEGGDCFEFAYQLGQQKGVGQKEHDNGLVILLVTGERCIQFATGYGLEGALPDAVCKQIQMRYMNPYLKDNNWDKGMLNGINAVCLQLNKDVEKHPIKNNVSSEPDFIVYLVVGIFILIPILLWTNERKKLKCPNCGKQTLNVVSRRTISKINGVRTEETVYLCANCGHTKTVLNKINDNDDFNNHSGPFRGGIFMGGFGSRGGGGGFGGGSFGGGSFGGGGAGSRF